MQDLLKHAESVAALLKQRKETIAVSESSTGGLITASLLAVPGASAYCLGGVVLYTRQAWNALRDFDDCPVADPETFVQKFGQRHGRPVAAADDADVPGADDTDGKLGQLHLQRDGGHEAGAAATENDHFVHQAKRHDRPRL